MDISQQHLEIENELYKVALYFDENKIGNEQFTINCTDIRFDTSLSVCFESGDGFYLTKWTEIDETQTVKILGNKLIIALYQDLLCFDLSTLQIHWSLGLDENPIFEFLDIEEDILLRGETFVFRINMKGEVVWSTSGEDIWVNTDGEREMQIVDNHIILTDINSKKYRVAVEKTRGSIS